MMKYQIDNHMKLDKGILPDTESTMNKNQWMHASCQIS